MMRRGFTMIELLVVIAITTAGFAALMHLQVGAIRGAGEAVDMQRSVQLTEHLGNTLRMESLLWTPTSAPLNGHPSMQLLNLAPANTATDQTSGWIVAYAANAANNNDLRVGPVGNLPAYDSGILQEFTSGGTQTQRNFCVHYRLTWLVPDVLLRADIRVLWPRARGEWTTWATCPVTPQDMEKIYNFHQITTPITILRNVFVKQV